MMTRRRISGRQESATAKLLKHLPANPAPRRVSNPHHEGIERQEQDSLKALNRHPESILYVSKRSFP
jgi:hypothetical protein